MVNNIEYVILDLYSFENTIAKSKHKNIMLFNEFVLYLIIEQIIDIIKLNNIIKILFTEEVFLLAILAVNKLVNKLTIYIFIQ